MKIPFVDLKAQYSSIQKEIDAAVSAVITETAFVRGKYVSAFEEEYCNAYGVDHCISCANGTDALYIALKALDIGPGDEVITTALSWISTSETISQTAGCTEIPARSIGRNRFRSDTHRGLDPRADR